MKLKSLSLRHKNLFDKFLNILSHELAVYAFANIYIWKGLFDISWVIIEDSLCVFFKDKTGAFLYLPPLGGEIKPTVVETAFKIMDNLNKNRDISRIENVEEKDISFYKRLGYECVSKPFDYICLREELVELKGERFKSKRACYNYFLKHYQYTYEPFSLKDKGACLCLYRLWMSQRETKSQDPVYRGMLKDSLNALKILLDYYRQLDITGRVIKINQKLKAFSFGFPLNKDIFCIQYEITDLSIKGLAQFIFREFCSELNPYSYINIMDDSGLANLSRVKLSYHPARMAPSYIVRR